MALTILSYQLAPEGKARKHPDLIFSTTAHHLHYSIPRTLYLTNYAVSGIPLGKVAQQSEVRVHGCGKLLGMLLNIARLSLSPVVKRRQPTETVADSSVTQIHSAWQNHGSAKKHTLRVMLQICLLGMRAQSYLLVHAVYMSFCHQKLAAALIYHNTIVHIMAIKYMPLFGDYMVDNVEIHQCRYLTCNLADGKSTH